MYVGSRMISHHPSDPNVVYLSIPKTKSETQIESVSGGFRKRETTSEDLRHEEKGIYRVRKEPFS